MKKDTNRAVKRSKKRSNLKHGSYAYVLGRLIFLTRGYLLLRSIWRIWMGKRGRSAFNKRGSAKQNFMVSDIF